jgi:hypothetical protein
VGPGHGVVHAVGPHVDGLALFEQAEPHLCVDPEQVNPHTPAVQVATPFNGAGQTVAQLPQWVGSFAVSTH